MAKMLEFPFKLSKIHDVFHVSMLHRYISKPEHMVQIEELEVEPNLSYDEGATWERDNIMREQYP